MEESFNYQPRQLNKKDPLNDINSESKLEVIILSYLYNYKKSM